MRFSFVYRKFQASYLDQSLILIMVWFNDQEESIEKWRTETEEANKVEGAAKKNARVLQIMFNSWQFEDYEDTKLTLIETILSDVIKDIEDHREGLTIVQKVHVSRSAKFSVNRGSSSQRL